MKIIVLLIVVGVVPSVSGRLDLRAFEDDDVPYMFGCRRGRCGSAPPATNRRRWSDVRRLDLPDDVDGPLVVEASAKPFGGGDDYVDGRFSALADDDRRMMTFPYCSTTSVDECRSLLRRLERLRLRRRRLGTGGNRNVVVSRSGGTVVRLLGRRRRSPQLTDSSDAKATETAKATRQRDVRSPGSHAAFEASNRLMDQYREWRRQNGYGQQFARWGRGSSPADLEDDAAHRQKDGDVSSDDQSNNGTTNDHRRTRRSVVVEIEPEEKLPATERDMLDTYLAWRETHGYGTLAGRWG